MRPPAKLVSGAINHLTRDARIFDCHVAVSEAASLLFLLLWSENNLLCGLKQVLEIS
jgi:hypothetical protein